MMLFIVLAATLALAAAAMLARPWWWRGTTDLSDDVQALRLQLKQLDELHRAGTLTAEQRAQSKSLVEAKLLQALALPDTGRPGAAARPSVGLTAAMVGFMLAVAGGGYALLGSPRDLEVAPGTPLAQAAGTGEGAASAPHEFTPEQVAAMVDRLAERLKSHPDDPEGWVMLARSYVAMGKHPQAVQAFVQAQRLRPDDANLLADYADALAMVNNRSLEGEPSKLVERALQLDAKNPKALALAGTAAFERKDYAGAVRYWETLVQVEPADGPFSSQLQGGIAEARKLAGLPPTAAASAAAVAPAGAAAGQVAGTVTLAPALRERVGPDDTVFVFARAAQGARMPLAILRKQVRDLPLAFSLDDSMAMSPSANLSGAARVIVGARVSKSGNAMPQAGDLQGSSTEVAVGTTGLTVQIDQEVTR